MTKAEAEALCKSYGERLATYQEVETSWRKGTISNTYGNITINSEYFSSIETKTFDLESNI